MASDLAFGRRLYEWSSRHPALYRLGTWSMLFGREVSLRRRAIRSLGLSRGASVLDLACGHGVNFALLEAQVGPQGGVVAFDYSQGMLDFARRRALEGPGRVLNPPIRSIFKYTANWDSGKDAIGTLREVFGQADVQKLYGGSIFIAAAVKAALGDPA